MTYVNLFRVAIRILRLCYTGNGVNPSTEKVLSVLVMGDVRYLVLGDTCRLESSTAAVEHSKDGLSLNRRGVQTASDFYIGLCV